MSWVEQIKLCDIDRGLAEHEISEFWSAWRDNKGLVDGSFSTIVPLMTTCRTSAVSNVSPPFLHIGSDSFVRRCFGREWARTALAGGATPDTDLERIAASGYAQATAGEPSFDLVSVQTISDVAEIDLLYQRLILPLHTQTGYRLLGCVAAPVRPIEILSWRDDVGRHEYSREASRQPEYGSAARPNGFQQAAYDNSLVHGRNPSRRGSLT